MDTLSLLSLIVLCIAVGIMVGYTLGFVKGTDHGKRAALDEAVRRIAARISF